MKDQITSTRQLQVEPRIKFEISRTKKKVSTSSSNGRSIEYRQRVKRENERRFSVLREAGVNYLANVKDLSRKKSKKNLNVTKQTLKEKNLKTPLPR